MRFYSVLKTRNARPINLGKIEREIEKICRKFNILLLYLYGSYATGKQTKLSDIDIAYLPSKKLSLKEEIDFLKKIEEIFEDEGIDLIDLNKAPLTLIHRVLKEGKCLYAKNLGIKIEFETKKEIEYLDTFWMRKEYFEKMVERIENGSLWD